MKMRKYIPLIDTLTEVALAFVLIGVISGSFWMANQLNPVAKVEAPVLGINKETKAWEFMQDKNFSQTQLMETDGGFTADYLLKFTHIGQQNNYNLFSLNNIERSVNKYRIVVTGKEDIMQYLTITGGVAEKQESIYNARTDAQYRDLVVSIPKGNNAVFSLGILPQSESLPESVNITVTVEKVTD
jgi:hypothetical protein